MNTESNTPKPLPRPVRSRGVGPPVVAAQDLLAGGRELIIEHGAETYRLQLTSSNKLLLTK